MLQIATHRLQSQQFVNSRLTTPAEVVAWYSRRITWARSGRFGSFLRLLVALDWLPPVMP